MHEMAHDWARPTLAPPPASHDCEFVGPAYGGLEEAKADVVRMFGLQWLVDHGALPMKNWKNIGVLHRWNFPPRALAPGSTAGLRR
jgi:hypothetical protein